MFLGTTPFNWTWNSWTKSKWTFMNIAFWWKCSILRVAWLRRFIVTISLLFLSEQQQKQTEIAICSQNCIQILEFAIDFWCLQLTFDVFNWVYSKHMIHYNKVNWKKFSKKFLKIFPIDFQSPIDFSQLHMIRPQKSIENIKSQLQTSKVNGKLQILNTILRTFLLFLFVSVVDQQEKEEKSELWICGVIQALDIEYFIKGQCS